MTVNVPHPTHIYPILVYVNMPVILSWTMASVSVLNLPFNEVNQMAGAARTAPERSPHGLYFIQR
nr:MAG TPA: hypothetical protein [Caudoviricetes sp.]